MAAPDVPMKPIAAAASAIVVVVALATGAVFGLLRIWHLPPSAASLRGTREVAGLAGAAPALQSAPQLEGAAFRAAKARELAASEAAR